MVSTWKHITFWFVVVASATLQVAVPAAVGAAPTELEIVAQSSFVDGPLRPYIKPADKPADPLVIPHAHEVYPLVIRSVEELVAISSKGREAAELAAAKKDGDLQAEVEQLLLTSLKLQAIDWEKQMVVAVLGAHAYRAPPRWKFLSLKTDGDKLVVEISADHGEFGCGVPWAVAVVDRFDGEIEFKGETMR